MNKKLFILVALFAFSCIRIEIEELPREPEEAAVVKGISEFEINGLKIIHKRVTANEVISVNLYIKGGSRNITAENAGIENLMLIVARRGGTVKFPKDTLNALLSSMGTTITSIVNFDFSTLSMRCVKPKFNKSWEIFCDIMTQPLFDENETAIYQEQLVNQLKQETDDPDSYVRLISNRLLFKDHPYYNKPEGTVESVSELTPDDLKSYHDENMVGAKLLMVVVGDISLKELKGKITKGLGNLKRGYYREVAVPEFPAVDAPELDIVQRDLPTNYIRGLFAVPNLANPDYPAMYVAISILRNRLFEEVRTKRNLSYAPYSGIAQYAANYGLIYVTAEHPNLTLTVMLDEINRLQTELIPKKEWRDNINVLLTRYYLELETNNAQANLLARYELVGGGWHKSQKIANLIRKVKSKDVMNVAQRYIKNIHIGVLGGPGEIDREIFLSK
jgi:zinc protease